MIPDADRFQHWWPYLLAAANHQAGHYDYRTHILHISLRDDARKENIVDPDSLYAAVEKTVKITCEGAAQSLREIAGDFLKRQDVQVAIRILQDPAQREEKHVVLISQHGLKEMDAFVFPTAMLHARKARDDTFHPMVLALAGPGAGKSGTWTRDPRT